MQRLVIMHQDTRDLETYAMSLVLYKPLLVIKIGTLESRSIYFESFIIMLLFLCAFHICTIMWFSVSS